MDGNKTPPTRTRERALAVCDAIFLNKARFPTIDLVVTRLG
ncbi:hypothetical protein [Methylothermus subterraneus]